jgi:hypothetical protein
MKRKILKGRPVSWEDRFWSNVVKDPDEWNGCWIWTGAEGHWGYGTFSLEGETYSTHRLSYIMHYGEIPVDLMVLHYCDTPPCVRPDHLFLGTQLDNQQDRRRKGR